MKTISSTFSGAGTDLRFKQGLVLAMLEEANRAVLAAAGYAVKTVPAGSQSPTGGGREATTPGGQVLR